MAKRKPKSQRPGRAGAAASDPPALTGIALLLSEYPADKLDLHGMTAAQAEPRVMAFMKRQSHTASGRVVHIITGKGNRSEGAPVLPGLVRALLDDDLTRLVREVAGLPGGGGVAVRLR